MVVFCGCVVMEALASSVVICGIGVTRQCFDLCNPGPDEMKYSQLYQKLTEYFTATKLLYSTDNNTIGMSTPTFTTLTHT